MKLIDLQNILNGEEAETLVKGLRKIILQEFEQLESKADDSGQPKAHAGLMQDYLESSPMANELFVLWDLPARESSGKLAASHSRLLALVLSHRPQSALQICRRIVKERLKGLFHQLSSDDPDLGCATLELLAAMVRISPFVARELFQKFDFAAKTFARLLAGAHQAPTGQKAQKRRQEGRAALRKAAVRYLLSFLVWSDPVLLAKMLAHRGPLGMIWRRLSDDPPKAIVEVLQIIRHRVITNKKISQRAKSDFFNIHCLEKIVQIYTSSAHNSEDAGSDGVFQEASLFLRALLLEPQSSPYKVPKQGEAAEGVNHTKIILKVLLHMSPHKDIHQRNLVFAVLNRYPALVEAYVRQLVPPGLDMKDNFEQVRYLTLISRLVQQLPSRSCFIPLPLGLGKKELTKGFLHSNPLIRRAFMLAVLQVLRYLEGNLKERQSNHLRQRLPDVQTLLSLRTVFSPETSSDELDSPNGNCKVHMYGIILDTLLAYIKTIPQAIEAARFDFLKLWPPDISLWSSHLQISLLQLLEALQKQTDMQHLNWFGTPHLKSLLNLFVETAHEEVYCLSKSLIERILLGSGLAGAFSSFEPLCWLSPLTAQEVPFFTSLMYAANTKKATLALKGIEALEAYAQGKMDGFVSETLTSETSFCISPLLVASLTFQNESENVMAEIDISKDKQCGINRYLASVFCRCVQLSDRPLETGMCIAALIAESPEMLKLSQSGALRTCMYHAFPGQPKGTETPKKKKRSLEHKKWKTHVLNRDVKSIAEVVRNNALLKQDDYHEFYDELQEKGLLEPVIWAVPLCEFIAQLFEKGLDKALSSKGFKFLKERVEKEAGTGADPSPLCHQVTMLTLLNFQILSAKSKSMAGDLIYTAIKSAKAAKQREALLILVLGHFLASGRNGGTNSAIILFSSDILQRLWNADDLSKAVISLPSVSSHVKKIVKYLTSCLNKNDQAFDNHLPEVISKIGDILPKQERSVLLKTVLQYLKKEDHSGNESREHYIDLLEKLLSGSNQAKSQSCWQGAGVLTAAVTVWLRKDSDVFSELIFSSLMSDGLPVMQWAICLKREELLELSQKLLGAQKLSPVLSAMLGATVQFNIPLRRTWLELVGKSEEGDQKTFPEGLSKIQELNLVPVMLAATSQSNGASSEDFPNLCDLKQSCLSSAAFFLLGLHEDQAEVEAQLKQAPESQQIFFWSQFAQAALLNFHQCDASLEGAPWEDLLLKFFKQQHKYIPLPRVQALVSMAVNILDSQSNEEKQPLHKDLTKGKDMSTKAKLWLCVLAFLLQNTTKLLKEDDASQMRDEEYTKGLQLLTMILQLPETSNEQMLFHGAIKNLEQHLLLNQLSKAVKHFMTSSLKRKIDDPSTLQAFWILSRSLYETMGMLCFLSEGYSENIWSCEKTYARIIGHSKFFEALGSEGPTSATVDLLKLLVGFVSLDTSLIMAAVVPILLRLYDASMSEKDLLICRLLRLFQDHTKCLPPNACRWGEAHSEISSTDFEGSSTLSGNFEWFLTSIDRKRILHSLCNFPLERALTPSSLDFEAGQHKKQSYLKDGAAVPSEGEFIGDNMDISDGSDASESSDNEETEEEEEEDSTSEVSSDKRHFNNLHKYLKGSSSDPALIYDPAFVLPLLDSTIRISSITSKRFFECGLVSYAIAALSSYSKSIRACAYSVLQQIDTQMQQETPLVAAGFHERLQLMVLLRLLRNSVTNPDFQRFPPIFTLALARAALIMMTPIEEVYPAINSFLLHRPRIATNEVPMFNAMFCSGTQSYKKERAWALSLLADGCRTDQDFCLLARDHCPALVLALLGSSTMADMSCHRWGPDVLLACAQTYHGAGHLLNTLGIVSWVRGLLENSQSDTSLPFLAKLIRLLALLLEQGVAKEQPPTRLMEEYKALVPCVCTVLNGLSLKSEQHASSDNVHSQKATFIEAINLLWRLQSLLYFPPLIDQRYAFGLPEMCSVINTFEKYRMHLTKDDSRYLLQESEKVLHQIPPERIISLVCLSIFSGPLSGIPQRTLQGCEKDEIQKVTSWCFEALITCYENTSTFAFWDESKAYCLEAGGRKPLVDEMFRSVGPFEHIKLPNLLQKKHCTYNFFTLMNQLQDVHGELVLRDHDTHAEESISKYQKRVLFIGWLLLSLNKSVPAFNQDQHKMMSLKCKILQQISSSSQQSEDTSFQQRSLNNHVEDVDTFHGLLHRCFASLF